MSISFLFPRWLRSAAYLLIPTGAALLIARFVFGFKPDFLEIKVFAIYSAYLEAKRMSIIQNQVIEELGAMLLLSGLFLLAFTKEKNENAQTNAARLNSFFIAAYTTFFLIICGIVFTYGLGFAFIMTLNLLVWLIAYIISFKYLIYRTNTRHHSSGTAINNKTETREWQPN